MTGTHRFLVPVGVVSLAAPPDAPVIGETYFDTALGQLRSWDGTIWVGTSSDTELDIDFVNVPGDAMTGELALPDQVTVPPSAPATVATKGYVDQLVTVSEAPPAVAPARDGLIWTVVEHVLTYPERIRSLNPLSYWRLGEVVDSSGAVDEMGLYGCTYTGSPTLGVPGLLVGDTDTAMQVFGIANQGATAGNPLEYQLDVCTLEAWVSTTNAGASYRAILVKQDTFGVFAIDNVLSVYEWGTGLATSSGVNIADGARHHVVVVFQPSGSQMYLDGVAVGPPFTHLASNQYNSLSIGYAGFAGQEFTGTIDEAAIYGRVLTAEEVAGNYQLGTTAPPQRSGRGRSW